MLVDPVAEFFARLEMNGASRRHEYGLPRFRVTPLLAVMDPDAEATKAPDLDPLAVNQGFAQVVEQDFDYSFNPGCWQIWVLFSKTLDEVGSVHVLVAQPPSDVG